MDFAQRSRCLKWLDIKGLWPTGGDYQTAFESLPLRHKNNGLQQLAVTLLFYYFFVQTLVLPVERLLHTFYTRGNFHKIHYRVNFSLSEISVSQP